MKKTTHPALRSAIARVRRVKTQPSKWKVGTHVQPDHAEPGSHERVGDHTLRVHAPFGHIDVKKKMSHDDWIAHAATHGPDVLHHAMVHYHKTGKINADTISQAKKKATPKKSKKIQNEEREMSNPQQGNGRRWKTFIEELSRSINVKQIEERSLTPLETAEKERIVKGMKKNLAGFKKRYGEKAKSVMYATATKAAKRD